MMKIFRANFSLKNIVFLFYLVTAACGGGGSGGGDGESAAAVASPLPEETVPPETTPPEAIPPETIPPETTPPETIPPETTPPETIPPESIPPEPIPPETPLPETLTVRWTAPLPLSSDGRPAVIVGFNVYRGATETELELLTVVEVGNIPPLDEETTFTDSTVVTGERYFYAISAFDGLGIESPRSAAVSKVAP